MRDLTEEELNELVSNKVADYENGISLFVPLTSDQPVIMYTSISRGIPSMHYLGVEIKRKYAGGLYVYSPKKPFDISENGLGDNDIDEVEIVDGTVRLHLMANDLPYIELSKDDAISIAKALGVTGEDLLL